MKNKSNLVAYGLMSLALVLGIVLSVNSVKTSQDTRSSAAEEETTVVTDTDEEIVDGVCGEANGKAVKAIPENEEACNTGAINWYDSEGTDGEYNWTCIGTEGGIIDECTALTQ